MGKLNITKSDGNLGRRNPIANMISGLVLGGIATGSLSLGDVSPKLTSAQDAVDLGIDASYDATNKILVYYHIKEFFRINPDGELYIMLVAQGTSLTDMCDDSNPYVQKLITEANGEIRQYGVVLNPDNTYTPTLSGGLDEDVIDAIASAQALGNKAFNEKRPVFGVIEGREFNGTVASADDLRLNEAEYVGVTILQDPDVADNDALYENHAAVGTTLGAISLAAANEDIGWTRKFNLQDKTTGDFLNVFLSDNNPATNYESNYSDLTTKGFIFGRKYSQQAGVYFDAFSTCALITSDFAYGPEVRIINKAARLIYDALFPRVNGPLLLNPDTGALATSTVKEMEAEGIESLSIMNQDQEISGADVYIDPSQDVQTTGVLNVKFKVVNYATGREINAEIGLAQSLN